MSRWIQSAVYGLFLPGPGKVGPEGDEVAWEVSLGVPVRFGGGEGLPEHVLQVVSVVRPNPGVVGSTWTNQQAGLWQQVGVGVSGPGWEQLPVAIRLCKVTGWGI